MNLDAKGRPDQKTLLGIKFGIQSVHDGCQAPLCNNQSKSVSALTGSDFAQIKRPKCRGLSSSERVGPSFSKQIGPWSQKCQRPLK